MYLYVGVHSIYMQGSKTQQGFQLLMCFVTVKQYFACRNIWIGVPLMMRKYLPSSMIPRYIYILHATAFEIQKNSQPTFCCSAAE